MRTCCVCGHQGHGLERAGEQRGPGGKGWLPTFGCIDVRACIARIEARDTKTPRTAELGGVTAQGA